MEWNEEKAQEIIRKHKNRFSLRLSLNIIRVGVALFILYAIYMMAISIFYDHSTIGKRTEFYQKLAIDWTDPALTTELFSDTTNEISPFLTQKISIPLEQSVGGKNYVVSKLELRKPLLTAFTTINIDKIYPYVASEDGFNFELPYNPKSGKKLPQYEDTTVWHPLDRVHEGHVATIAFSLNDYYAPKEVVDLLKAYDVTVLWMPLYMGELQKYTEGGWGGGSGSMSLNTPWGLSGAKVVDDDFRGGSSIRWLTADTVEESEEAMIQNMEMMLSKNKSLAERLLGTHYLQERLDYLQNDGFQAYGAVVTGPVKELLKLKERKEIYAVQLGEIKPWNLE